jgi:hypothetical protein
VLGVHALQTPPAQPAAPQFIVDAGVPSWPHVIASAPLQYATPGSHVLHRFCWQPCVQTIGFTILPSELHMTRSSPLQNVVLAAHSLQRSTEQPYWQSCTFVRFMPVASHWYSALSVPHDIAFAVQPPMLLSTAASALPPPSGVALTLPHPPALAPTTRAINEQQTTARIPHS